MHRILFLFCVVVTVSIGLSYLSLQAERFDTYTKVPEFQYGTQSVSSIPNIIWTFWHDENNIPELVKACIQSWKYHNPGYKVHVLSNSTIKDFLPDLDVAKLRNIGTISQVSDQVRLHLLDKYGGFWIDASILCTDSLSWVHAIQHTKQCELVGYYLGGFTTDPNYPVIESWFFASVPNGSIVHEWKQELTRMTTFPSVEKYLEQVENIEKVNLQNIQSKTYLVIHVAAQVVFQKYVKNHTELQQKIHLLPAEEGPFKYLAKNGWEQEHAFKSMCSQKQSSMQLPPLIKFRGSEREYLEKHPEVNCIHSETVI